MKKILIYYIGAFFLVLLWSCSDLEDWGDPTDDISPGTVSNVNVENLNGGARITYTLPDDDDLLGVKALYSYGDDENREAFSSAFKDTIMLEGFADTSEYVVKLITLDKSKNESQPVIVKIKPLLPPVDIIRKSLIVKPTFGGVYVKWNNINEADIAVEFFVLDSLGEYQWYDTHYSNSSEGKNSFRGLENVERSFRVELRDKWNNYSYPLDTILTPLFEEEIVGRDHTGYIWERWGFADKTCLYRGDLPNQHTASWVQFENIHDNIYPDGGFWNTGPERNWVSIWATSWEGEDYELWPFYFTLNMNREASYSRIKYWMRDRKPTGSAQTWIRFEVWGTNNPKPINEIGDGSRKDNLKYWTEWPEVGGTDAWKNDWVQLGDFTLTYPGGADPKQPGNYSNEVIQFILAGFEFEFNPEHANEPFQYLRFVIKENRGPASTIQLSELKFWGQYH